ncbi:UNVERIFIED_ORG: hypothetical protein JN05_01219 [Zoogloea ramigera]|uniref:Uncharacterized protein n=1 Tax=Duganella zoogloeoides TaxID=75659 RepID=A0ABZ0Y456_9BURK|nr:hypothetical protein [Duganella zoogloeoides]WQH06824.1 hypothetical protein SR858_10990 [Duganella zoogloeoides]
MMDAIRNAGAKLANLAYNLSQSDALPVELRASLDDCRKEWDAAVSAAPVPASALAPAKLMSACWCTTCRPVTLLDSRMVLCPTCGNKRCPRANDHRHDCTGSNLPGQPRSSCPAAASNLETPP